MLFAENLKRGDIFIDIEVNIGIHALHDAFRFGPIGQCFAIEPNPTNFSLLQAHLIINRIQHVNFT